jgi:hypothetical protein
MLNSNPKEAIATFNEWMQRYIDNPEQFNREFQEVTQFLQERNDGHTPSYGESCTAYFNKIHADLFA